MTRNSRRQTRVSLNQQETIVQFLEQNGSFVTKKFSSGPDFTNQDLDRMWNILTELLNSDRTGPAKSKDKWKKVLADWKCNTKAKAAQLKREPGETGDGVNSAERLTSLEERLLDALGEELLGGVKPSVEFLLPSSDLPVTDKRKRQAKNSVVMPTTGNSKTSELSIGATKMETSSREQNLQQPNVRPGNRAPIMIKLNTSRESTEKPIALKQTFCASSSEEQYFKFDAEDDEKLQGPILEDPLKVNEKRRKRLYTHSTAANPSGPSQINSKKGRLRDASKTLKSIQNSRNSLLKAQNLGLNRISQALARQAEATEALVEVKKEKNDIAREMVQVLQNVVDVLAGKI